MYSGGEEKGNGGCVDKFIEIRSWQNGCGFSNRLMYENDEKEGNREITFRYYGNPEYCAQCLQNKNYREVYQFHSACCALGQHGGGGCHF